MNVVGLDSLESRAAGYTASERIDPYWAGLWNVTSTASWVNRRGVERQVEQGIIKAPAWLSMSANEACERIAEGQRRARRTAMIASLGCFRTMTHQQLGCCVGAFRTGRADTDVLLASGIIQAGTPVSALGNKPSMANWPLLLRPANNGDLSILLDKLDHRTRVGILQGQPWRTGTMADRHNVLACELLLRIAEYTDVSLVVGEQLAGLPALTGHGHSSRAGDGAFVRDDGAFIAIEVTASVSTNFPSKVSKWVQALVDNPELHVVFVDISHPDTVEAGTTRVTKTMHKAIVHALDDAGIGALSTDAHSRIMTASYSTWFPSAHQVDTDSFLTLAARRPTGTAGQRWEDVEMLDPFELSSSATGRALVENSNLLLGVPSWMRTGTAELTL